MKITYLDHSGFAVEYQKYVLIFDWYKGKLPEFDSEKEIYVFSSHSHYDHFDRKIFELENIYSNVRYVLSADITEKLSLQRYGLLLPTKNIGLVI